MVLTSRTVTLKSFWTASLIWILLALGATSKITWFCSRRRFDFSVRMMGRRMSVSGVSIGSVLLQAPRFEGLRRVSAHDQVIVTEQIVDVDPFGRKVLMILEVADRHPQVLVTLVVDDQGFSRHLQRTEDGR